MISRAWKPVALLFLLASAGVTWAAKPPTVPLNCGNVSGYKSEAERQYLDKASGGGDMYTVFVTFIEKKPGNKVIDKALRECLAEAIKMDGSKDILAMPWFRKKTGGKPVDDDLIHLYGPMKSLVYTKEDKKIIIHTAKLK